MTKYALTLIQREITGIISGVTHYNHNNTFRHCKECGKPLRARNQNPDPKKRTGLCQSCRAKSLGKHNLKGFQTKVMSLTKK